MSSQQHQRIKQQPSVEDEVDLNMCIPGLGENKIRPRVLGSSFFGYVADAYSPRTPCLPSERLMESVIIPLHLSNNYDLEILILQVQQKAPVLDEVTVITEPDENEIVRDEPSPVESQV